MPTKETRTSMHIRELVSDERDRLSSARVSWWVLVFYTCGVILLDTLSGDLYNVPGAAYTLLGTLTFGVLTWAAGPRIAQWIGPQIAGIGRGISSAGDRQAGTDNARRDDERG